MWTLNVNNRVNISSLQLKSIHYFPEYISSIQLKVKKNVNRKIEEDKVRVTRLYLSPCVFLELYGRSNKIKVIKLEVYRCDVIWCRSLTLKEIEEYWCHFWCHNVGFVNTTSWKNKGGHKKQIKQLGFWTEFIRPMHGDKITSQQEIIDNHYTL